MASAQMLCAEEAREPDSPSTWILVDQSTDPAPSGEELLEVLPPPPVDRDDSDAEQAYHDDWIVVEDEPLPPLHEELWDHGGSYLYAPEGDRLNWPVCEECAHYDLLRLPECWQEPRPLNGARPFLSADAICLDPVWRWFGCEGYVWEPRLVGHGGYELFAFSHRENNQRQDIVGHQLVVDLDLRLTGTERFHIQYRPIGRENTGGSYYQFNGAQGYLDNSTGEPDRYWFEGELHSILGADFDPFAALDYNFTVGRVPVLLHNQLLMNDELLAAIVSKNTLIFDHVSNLNIQGIYGFSDVTTLNPDRDKLFALHASVDLHRVFYEATYALVAGESGKILDKHYAALSRTAIYGPTTVALRALLKWGDQDGLGEGQLFAVEAQRVRIFDRHPCGVEEGVFYCNTFLATQGWSPIAGGNFNRLTLAFEVNPLVQISATPVDDKVWGVAMGVQLFRHHKDESLIPEIAFEDRGGEPAVGFGLRWLRKTGPRTYLEALGLVTESSDPMRDREGIAVRHTTLF